MDNHKKLFEGLLKADGISPAGATESERIAFAKMLDRQLKSKPSKPEAMFFRPNIWRIIMKSKITKFAAAAVVVVAVLAGINRFEGSIDGTSVAWGDALKQIYEATSVSYLNTFEGDKENPFYFKKMINENGVIRAEIGGQIEIYAGSEGKSLSLVPSSKEAILDYSVGAKHSTKPYNHLDWLASIKDKTSEYLGIEDVDGIEASKFFWQRGEYENVTVWIDPATELPLKVIQEFIPNPDKSIIQPEISLALSNFGGADGTVGTVGGMGGKGVQRKMVVIMKDFIWNEKFDPNLFSTEPPKGYSLRVRQNDVSELGENYLVKALAFWTEMSGGKFPQKINNLVDPNQINIMLIKKFNKDGDPREELDEAIKQAGIITRGLFFAQNKKADQNWYYQGNAYCFGDSEAMICWWKEKDSNDFRVIFGDLSIGTIAADKMPK